MGVIRTHVMVTDAQRFLSALVRMVTAGGVLSVLNPVMLPLLLLAVLPAGVGAVLTARVDYESHYANIADRNVRGRCAGGRPSRSTATRSAPTP